MAEGVGKYLPKNAMKLRKFSYFCWGGGGAGGGGRGEGGRGGLGPILTKK